MKRFQNILALLPEDSPEEAVINWTQAIAKASEAKKVTVLSNREQGLPEFPVTIPEPASKEEQRKELEQVLKPLLPTVELEVKIEEGDFLTTTLYELSGGDYDLVIVPLLGPENRNTVLRLARKSPAGVLAVPEGCKAPPSSILVGVDYSKMSAMALEWAEAFASLSEGESTRLEVVNTFRLPNVSRATLTIDPDQLLNHIKEIAEEELDQFITQTAKNKARWNQSIGESTLAGRFLADRANKMQTGLLVVGSHGSGAFKIALLGSHTADILRKSERPVLVAKPKNESLGFLKNLLGL